MIRQQDDAIEIAVTDDHTRYEYYSIRLPWYHSHRSQKTLSCFFDVLDSIAFI